MRSYYDSRRRHHCETHAYVNTNTNTNVNTQAYADADGNSGANADISNGDLDWTMGPIYGRFRRRN